MNQFSTNLVLDKDMLPMLISYYLYRSEEQEHGRPVIDGVCIQRGKIGEEPPDNMTLSLEWE